MRTGVLRGPEQTRLGGIATIAEGREAIALSVGGARKTYPHRDPNEDAAAFADGEGGFALAVADGHSGHEAAALAVERLLASFAPHWTADEAPGLRESWKVAVRDAMVELDRAICEEFATGALESPRTTLALALARPGDDLLAFASVGDSHIFRVGDGEVVDLARIPDHRVAFLGSPGTPEDALRRSCAAGTRDLAGTRALVLVTDGFSERGIGVEAPPSAVAECAARAARAAPELRPLEAVRAVAERALAAHRRHRSGDNVASAVLWL